MKKISTGLILIIFLLVGCSGDERGDAIIKEASLSDFQKNLLTLSGEGPFFIHEVKIMNDEVNEMYLYIDLYKNGQHIGTVLETGSDVSEEVFHTVFLNLPSTKMERNWVSAMMWETGYVSSNAKNELELKENFSSAWGSVSGEINLSIGEKVPIASLVYSNKESIGVINDLSTDDALAMQTDYEEVYIFSVEIR